MLKKLIKSTIVSSFYFTGLLACYKRSVLRNKAIILMYHRVLPINDLHDPPVQSGMYVSVDSFRMHIHFLKSHFNIISLEELVERLAVGKTVNRCCVLTFDDGWRDNFQYAYPVLKEYGVPATIFLTAGFIGTESWFWPEEVSFCLLKVKNEGASLGVLPGCIQKELREKGVCLESSLEKCTDCVVELLKEKSPTERIDCMRQLKETFGVLSNGKRLLLNWDEVREMEGSGLIEFGSHTMNHTLLDQLPPGEAQGEIGMSRDVIEEKTGKECVSFAYPNGNYTERTITSLEKTGFTVALTTKRGYVTPASTLLELPRVAVHEDVSCSIPLLLWRLVAR